MKARNFMSCVKAGMGSAVAATALVTFRYCLYAPELVGQLMQLFN